MRRDTLGATSQGKGQGQSINCSKWYLFDQGKGSLLAGSLARSFLVFQFKGMGQYNIYLQCNKSPSKKKSSFPPRSSRVGSPSPSLPLSFSFPAFVPLILFLRRDRDVRKISETSQSDMRGEALISANTYHISHLGWYITQLSPQGPPSEPQSDKKCHKNDLILFKQLFFFEGKRGIIA